MSILKQWDAGNEAGDGWAPEGTSADDRELSTIREAVEGGEEGVVYLYTEDQILVFERSSGGYFGVADANGPWAVDLEEV